MIDTQSLKNKIIDLATSGQLSKNHTCSDSVEDVICSLPEPSMKRKKLLKQDFEYDDVEVIPNHWKWISLGKISSYGDAPQKIMPSEVNGNTWILELEDIEAGGKILEKKRATHSTSKGEKTVFNSGQVLYSKLRPYLKKVLVADEDGVSTPELVSFDVFNGIIAKYILLCLLNTYTDKVINKRSYGIKMPRVDAGFMVNLPIPLPPVSEQKYIVSKVEKIFSEIETIEKLQNQYAANSEILKSKLIDAAIQGKLTEQLPSDGTAEELYQQIQTEKQALISAGKIKKEKPLKEIEEDEIPFEIPESWKWVYMGDIFQHNTGKALNSSDKEGELLEYITTSNMYWDHFELNKLKQMRFKPEEIEKCTITKGDLLVCEGGDIGRSAIWNYDYDMRIQNHIHRLRGYLKEKICAKFYYYVMWFYKHSGLINGRGIGLQGFSSKRLHNLVVPLPPLEEQKRIVSSLEELLTNCV